MCLIRRKTYICAHYREKTNQCRAVENQASSHVGGRVLSRLFGPKCVEEHYNSDSLHLCRKCRSLQKKERADNDQEHYAVGQLMEQDLERKKDSFQCTKCRQQPSRVMNLSRSYRDAANFGLCCENGYQEFKDQYGVEKVSSPMRWSAEHVRRSYEAESERRRSSDRQASPSRPVDTDSSLPKRQPSKATMSARYDALQAARQYGWKKNGDLMSDHDELEPELVASFVNLSGARNGSSQYAHRQTRSADIPRAQAASYIEAQGIPGKQPGRARTNSVFSHASAKPAPLRIPSKKLPSPSRKPAADTNASSREHNSQSTSNSGKSSAEIHMPKPRRMLHPALLINPPLVAALREPTVAVRGNAHYPSPNLRASEGVPPLIPLKNPLRTVRAAEAKEAAAANAASRHSSSSSRPSRQPSSSSRHTSLPQQLSRRPTQLEPVRGLRRVDITESTSGHESFVASPSVSEASSDITQWGDLTAAAMGHVQSYSKKPLPVPPMPRNAAGASTRSTSKSSLRRSVSDSSSHAASSSSSRREASSRSSSSSRPGRPSRPTEHSEADLKSFNKAWRVGQLQSYSNGPGRSASRHAGQTN